MEDRAERDRGCQTNKDREPDTVAKPPATTEVMNRGKDANGHYKEAAI